MAATYLERATIAARVSLVDNLTLTSEKTSMWLKQVTSGFVAKGIPASMAHQKALALLDALLNQQAVIIGYNYVFMLAAVLFVICIPLVWLFPKLKGNKQGGSLIE